MTWNVIAVRPGVPSQRSRVTLEGVEYVVVLRWSQREERWYLDLFAANGAPLALGLRLALEEPHFRTIRQRPGLPPGELTMFDQRETRAYPTLDELGDVVQLIYIDTAHVAASGGTAEPVYRWGA